MTVYPDELYFTPPTGFMSVLITSYQTWQLLIISLICFIASMEESFSASPSKTGRLPDSCDTNIARFLAQTCVRGWKEKKSGIRLSPKHYLFSSLKSHTLWLQLIHLLRFPCREIIQHTLIFCVMTVNFKTHRKPV